VDLGGVLSVLPDDVGGLRCVFEVQWRAVELVVGGNVSLPVESGLELASAFKTVLSLESDESSNGLCQRVQFLLLQIVDLLVDSAQLEELAVSDALSTLTQQLH
jgi:hypothetical protein